MDGGLTFTLRHVFRLRALYPEMRPMLVEAIDRHRTLARVYLQPSFR